MFRVQYYAWSIAALGSKRINLSPFTKGCRDQGASMRLQTIFYRGTAPITTTIQLNMARACGC